MPDQDDFESGGKAWNQVYRMYVEGDPPQEIVALLQSRIALLLKVSGGIPHLPFMVEAVQRLEQGVIKRSLWQWQSGQVPEQHFEETMRRLERICAPRRLEMVAIRSTRALATEVVSGELALAQPVALAERIVVDVACHCCLDRARALAVGKAFQIGLESHEFYQEILKLFLPHAQRMGRSLMDDPLGNTVHVDRKALRKTTHELMYGGDVSA